MSHTPYSLALSKDWDLELDNTGKIMTVKHQEATVQNTANECRLFTKDAYFDYSSGIPHFILELGAKSTPAAFRAYLQKAALKIPDVEKVLKIKIEKIDQEKRILEGEIQLKLKEGSHVTLIL